HSKAIHNNEEIGIHRIDEKKWKQGVPITSDLLSKTLSSLSNPLDPKCRVSDVSTSVDGTCVHRSILIFICRGISWYRSSALDAHRSIVLPLVDPTWSARVKRPLSSKMLQISLSLIFSLEPKSASIAGSVIKIGHASMNQKLMSSLRKRALKIAASKSRFELFYWSLYESSLNGFSHQVLFRLILSVTFQTCLKNPIPCIPSPKTSGYVRFSVGNQLWLLHTVK
ncbi:hypothetical protein IGI04_002815, partial [Brassica rapa subsp. trilocularis]